MSHYKKVIVAVDFDGGAHTVLASAFKLLSAKTEIRIINVVYNSMQEYNGYIGTSMFSYEAMVEFEKTVRKVNIPKLRALAIDCKLPDSDVIIQFGKAADAILDYADEEEADLIIVGSHGKHGVRLLLGSTANSILHRAKCDVLAVRIKQ